MSTVCLPIVSVIIPSYRQAHFLPEAIEAALGQTYPHTQVVVVNDGSDDGTEAVASSYGRRLEYVWKVNGGLSSARNAGARVARGDYFLFLDADDLLAPQAVERAVEAARRHPGALIVAGHRTFVGEHGGAGQDFIPSPDIFALPGLFFRSYTPCHACLCPAAWFRQEGGFDESLRACEDWDLWLRLVLRGIEVATVPEVLAFYRRHAASMSTDRRRMLEAMTVVLGGAHRTVRADPPLWNRWAGDLLKAEHNLLRACVANSLPRPTTQALLADMRDILSSETIKRSWRQRIGDRLLSERMERAVLLYKRWLEPAAFAAHAGTGAGREQP